MGIRVHDGGLGGLVMRLPLVPNRNHQQTAFAGSLNGVATNGFSGNGLDWNGFGNNGTLNGLKNNGIGPNGVDKNGLGAQGVTSNGLQTGASPAGGLRIIGVKVAKPAPKVETAPVLYPIERR